MCAVHLISFADGAFRKRAPVFRGQAEGMGVFDTVTVFSLDTLFADFRQAHGAYMQATSRGFGYWIWKPEIILRALEGLTHYEVQPYDRTFEQLKDVLPTWATRCRQ